MKMSKDKNNSVNGNKEKLYVLDAIAGVCFEASEKFYDKDNNLKYRVEPIKGKDSYVIESHDNMVELKGTDLIKGGELNSYLETGDNTSYLEGVLSKGLGLESSFKLRDVYTSPYANNTDLGVKFNKINSEIRKLDTKIGKIYGDHIDSTKAIKYRVNGLNDIMAKYDIAHDCRVYEKAGKKDSKMSYEKAAELVRKENLDRDKLSEKVKTKLNITSLENKLEAVPHQNRVMTSGKTGISTLMVASFAFVTGNFLGLGLAILIGGGSLISDFFKKYEAVDKEYVKEIKDAIENEKAKLKDIEKKEKAELNEAKKAEKNQNKEIEKAKLAEANEKIDSLEDKINESSKKIDSITDDIKSQEDINKELKDKINELEKGTKDDPDKKVKDNGEKTNGDAKPNTDIKDNVDKSKTDSKGDKSNGEKPSSKDDKTNVEKTDDKDDKSNVEKSDDDSKDPKAKDTETKKPDEVQEAKIKDVEKPNNDSEANKDSKVENNKPKPEPVVVKNPKFKSDYKIEGLKNAINFEHLVKDLDAGKNFEVKRVGNDDKVVRGVGDIDKSNHNVFEIEINKVSSPKMNDNYEPVNVKFSSEKNTSYINQIESSDTKFTFNKNILLNKNDRLDGSSPQDKLGKMIMNKDVGKPLEIKNIEVFDSDKNERVLVNKDNADTISPEVLEKIKNAMTDIVGPEFANELLDRFEPFNDNDDFAEKDSKKDGEDNTEAAADLTKEDINVEDRNTETASDVNEGETNKPDDTQDNSQDNKQDENNDGLENNEDDNKDSNEANVEIDDDYDSDPSEK